MEKFIDELFALKDRKYGDFQRRLIPNIDPETIIGVRTPELRRLAWEMTDGDAFKKLLPHKYFEENQVHSFLLEREKCFESAIRDVQDFLPYVDNWATCDQLNPKVFQRHHRDLLPHIRCWLGSSHAYTVRFGIKMLMDHFLNADFDPIYLEWVAGVQHEDYYVKMMAAWYFATALAKQYDTAFPYIAQNRLEKWVHNKAIQKSVESFRITSEQKEVLKQYRIK